MQQLIRPLHDPHATVRRIAPNVTRREREIANLIGLGFTNRQIGVELSISHRTAGAHVQNLLNKLGANNRAQIATWSAQESLSSMAAMARSQGTI